MRRFARALRVLFALLGALDVVFVSVVVLFVVVGSTLEGLRGVLLAILSGDRVVMGLTGAFVGSLMGWPALRELFVSTPRERRGDADPESLRALDAPPPS